MQTKTFSRISFLIILIISGFVLVRLAKQAASDLPPPEFAAEATSTPIMGASAEVMAPGGIIHTIVASTTAERERGLGERTSLASDAGMLFVFEVPGVYGFWMKDTLIPLDMIWIFPDKRVAGVASGISPETYPKVFYPPASIGYVLELSSGGAAKYGIATGTQLVF